MISVLWLSACDAETVEESLDLVSEGGEIQLRDDLRPNTPGPRVLVIGLDGVGVAALDTALQTGRFPSLDRWLGPNASPGGVGVGGTGWVSEGVVTVLPSITMAAWSTIFTGAPPSETGVPGNEWFDRRANFFHAPAPVSVRGKAHALQSLTEGLLGTWIRTPTVFERADVRSHVSMLHVHRGADILTVPGASDLGDILGAFSEGLATDESVDRELYSALDEAAAEGAVEAIEEYGVPRLQVLYFPGIDLYTHRAEDPPVDQQTYMGDVLDPAIGRLLEAYRQAGALDGLWILVVGDHGHTPVIADTRHALDSDGGDTPARLLEAGGWRVRPPELEVGDDSDHQAVLALQGAFAFVYLADRSTCPSAGDPCDWSRPPSPGDVDAVARLFEDASAGGGAGAEPADSTGGFLEMILVPERDTTGALTGVRRWARGERLALDASATDSAFVQLPERLDWLLDGPAGYLAGDLILMARSGAWVPRETRFYFSHPYRSWHGSAHAEDSRAPLVVLRPGSAPGEVAARVRQVLPREPDQTDLAGLILELLGRSQRGGAAPADGGDPTPGSGGDPD